MNTFLIAYAAWFGCGVIGMVLARVRDRAYRSDFIFLLLCALVAGPLLLAAGLFDIIMDRPRRPIL